MANKNKRYYWLKFQEDFFSSLRIKKLRKLGADYVIIYLEMQLLSLKTGGYLEYRGYEETFGQELALEIDEDPDKVQLTLAYLQSCGLLETADNNEFFLPYVEMNTGSETASTQRSRQCRAKKEEQKLLQCNTDATEVQQKTLQCNTDATQVQQECNDNATQVQHNCNKGATEVQQECNTTATTEDVAMQQKCNDRYKSIDIDKKKTLSKERVKEKGASQPFSAPTLDEVKDYCSSRQSNVDAEKFIDYYEARGWKGIKDWQAAFRVWEKREKAENPKESVIKKSTFKQFAQRDYDFQALEAKLVNQSG